ncbi:helix-turn-helix transcriptional regulator [Amycolatopsis sp. DSM 110486]|uniref:helix-turn-helix transcriptional regulator n=1 Tax=Amycolatopsis sp. DSM 110486 TaxID=2865832 RepID=UPI001C6A0F8C|nr:helix-turn-helix transcriptional regulator [Amycolatopsis sp. DSM 110486]QYN22969.1 helix-turn-helix transcriptional regulator [Amycolatopsis sp. DSM 110486]
MDRPELAKFLRARREALQPEDVGLRRGPRRRTSGLRREEVAALSGVSSDYYSRIEQQRGPVPSEQILAAIAHGLHLTLEERDHLFRLAGHGTPQRAVRGDHINAGLMRVFDRLEDTPAQIENVLGETLRQTPLAVALLGDETAYTGLSRARVFRWFTSPSARERLPLEDHAHHSRTLVARLAEVFAKTGRSSPAGSLVAELSARSPEFAALWAEHPVLGPYCEPKRLLHPEVGAIEVHGQTLLDPDQYQALLIFTAVPGTESHEKLQLLSVIGAQQL